MAALVDVENQEKLFVELESLIATFDAYCETCDLQEA